MFQHLTSMIRAFDGVGDIGETYDGVIYAALLVGSILAAITIWSPRIGAFAFAASQPSAWVVLVLLGMTIPIAEAIVFLIFSLGSLAAFALPGCLLRLLFLRRTNDA